MKRIYRGMLVALLHCAIVLSLAGKYAVDRGRLPRVWVKTAPFDPNLPVRGRYVSLSLQVDAPKAVYGTTDRVRLSAQNGQLVVRQAQPSDGVPIWRRTDQLVVLAEPVAFFIPEHVPDPSRRAPGEELWVEVSVPERGMPRPIRLGVKKDGVLLPLSFEN